MTRWRLKPTGCPDGRSSSHERSDYSVKQRCASAEVHSLTYARSITAELLYIYLLFAKDSATEN